MDKVKNPAESDAAGPPSQEPTEPRGPSSKPPAYDLCQRLYDLGIRGNFVESHENAGIGMLEETDDGDDTRGFRFVGPVIDRADVADLLEKEMPHIKGSWFLKGGGGKILSFRSLKLVITHDSKNTMMQVHCTSPRLPTPSTTIQLTSVSRAVQLTFPGPKQIHGRPCRQDPETLAGA